MKQVILVREIDHRVLLQFPSPVRTERKNLFVDKIFKINALVGATYSILPRMLKKTK